jgi:hypothetical protein
MHAVSAMLSVRVFRGSRPHLIRPPATFHCSQIYQLQFSLDNGVTWTNANVNYTSARRMLFTPTTPGKTYLIQICALGGSTAQSAWSNAVGIMAT